ncbi:hypothetical protein CK203_029768 [Vitis vinifera]|uniref:LINE-1 reverse transcriptase-like n=1 Tax=Vitis vinifera TaxID=29760 RepID=A0A438II93_VITVI|nr:hypothetical protein CK203_029768 [Vitis vinifera]
MLEGIVRSLGTGRFIDWRALNAEGAAGDYRKWGYLGFTGVYGPFTKVEREGMWEEFGAIRGLWDDLWCLGGDFNIILFQQERSSQRRISSAIRRFAETVDDLELVDLPLQGGEFTWNGRLNNQAWARLDRFLVSLSWLDLFSGVTQIRMASAHRRNNVMGRIKVNGEWLVEEQEVGCISQQEAESLEIPFAEIEIHAALMEMNGDKALGPDGFTVAFWQKHLGFFQRGDHGDVVSIAQNAFVMGRQILDASLIANEVIDSWQKRKEKGLICKLDIEKAYDCIKWNFLMKVLQKMGFGTKWVGWMWSCVSSAKFSILVNGVPAGFFPSNRGLRQGDPLSPYLFVMGMEILDVLIRESGGGGYLTGCNIRVRASGLRINLAKSEIIPVGEVEEILEMAVELGCRVGSLPSQYLGLPLGVPNRASSMWDGMEEKVRRRLALWKRQPSMEDDSVKWRQGRNGMFRVKEAYRLLDKPNATVFPARRIWVDRVPTKVCFFAWEATWGKVLTLDRLQKRGCNSQIVVFCVVVKKRM